MKLKTQKGITLIALVITIIVMMILVGVSVTVALNGGLFKTAKQASDETKTERDDELALSDGQITVNGETYASYDDYLKGKPMLVIPEDFELPESWEITNTPDAWTSSKVIPIKETATDKIIPLPLGYEISEVKEEQAVSTGLVITDGQNEFVWIPVSDELASSYTHSNGSYYSEPKNLTGVYNKSGGALDSQTTLDYLYGENYYNFEKDFNYKEEYNQMTLSVNKYNGFYIGKYETTIDNGGNVGSEYNTEILTANRSISQTNNKPCRWYGLYYAQKNADVSGNKEVVQTAMIYGVLWDKTMEYIREQKAAGYTTYDVDTPTASWHGSANGHTSIVNSAQANKGDVALNIWDLESNAPEFTQLGFYIYERCKAGGTFYDPNWSVATNGNCIPASSISSGCGSPVGVSLNSAAENTYFSSRLVLYIK